MAVNAELAGRAKQAVDDAGITTQVGYMYRFSKGVLKAKELLADRRVAMVQQHFYMPGLPDRDWWPSPSQDMRLPPQTANPSTQQTWSDSCSAEKAKDQNVTRLNRL